MQAPIKYNRNGWTPCGVFCFQICLRGGTCVNVKEMCCCCVLMLKQCRVVVC